MEDKLLFKVIDTDKIEKNAEILLFFKLNYDGKNYMIYTFDEKDSNGLVVLNVSEVVKDDDGKFILQNIEGDETWEYIKEIMRRVINENKGEED